MLIQRLLNPGKLFEQLSIVKDPKKVEFTSNEGFLNHMYDVMRISDKNELDQYMHKNLQYFEENPDVKRDVLAAFQSGKRVVNSIFDSIKFKKDLDDFLSDKANSELRSDAIWNVALLYSQLDQFWYRPVIHTFSDHLNQPLTHLHENINKFVNLYLKDRKIKDEMQLIINAPLSKSEINELKKVGLDKDLHSVSISGRLDLFDQENGQLYEVKASGLDHCSEEWVIQTLTYSCLLDMAKLKVKELFIVNVLKGIK